MKRKNDKILKKDINIEIEFAKFDKEIYKTINTILSKTYSNDSDINLKALTVLKKYEGMDLVKACTENYLTNNEEEEGVRLEIKKSGKIRRAKKK